MKPAYIFVVFTMSILFEKQAHCGSSDELCRGLATRILAGEANGKTEPSWQQSILERLSQHSNRVVTIDKPRISSLGAALKELKATPALAETANNAFGPSVDSWTTFTGRLGESGSGVLKQIAGTGHCENALYFDYKKNGAVSIPDPPNISKGACWDDVVIAGQIMSTPAIMEEEPGVAGSIRITVQPWKNHAWTRACRIEVKFSQMLFTDGAFCRDSIACSAMEETARRLVQRYKTIAPSNGGKSVQASSDLTPTDAQLLHGNNEIRELPEFGMTTSNPYSSIENAIAFPVRVAGKPAIGVVGGGSFGWRTYSGYLVAIWSVGDGGLTPLAGFQLQLRDGRVDTLSVIDLPVQ